MCRSDSSQCITAGVGEFGEFGKKSSVFFPAAQLGPIKHFQRVVSSHYVVVRPPVVCRLSVCL